MNLAELLRLFREYERQATGDAVDALEWRKEFFDFVLWMSEQESVSRPERLYESPREPTMAVGKPLAPAPTLPEGVVVRIPMSELIKSMSNRYSSPSP